MNSTDFYTYAYLRKDGTPYYVGKGKDFRAFSKNRVGIKLPKDKSRIIFLKQNLTEEEAFNHEIYMISVFGRKDLGTGILRNRTDGGEGTSNPSEETRKRIGKASKCRIRSEETRKKMSEALKGNKNKLDKTHSEETRKKISEANKGRALSEEWRKKLSEASKGRKWWNDGCGNTKFAIECPGPNWMSGRKRTLQDFTET